MEMAEYIERSAAIKAAKHAWAKGLEPSQYIEALPAADVAPVVYGRWALTGSIWKRETMRSSAPAAGISRKNTANLTALIAEQRWTEGTTLNVERPVSCESVLRGPQHQPID